MRKSDFQNKKLYLCLQIYAINYLQVMKNGGNCNAEYP